MEKKHTIAVAGTGYVGLSVATLLAQNNNVYAVDVMEGRVYKATKNEDGSYFIEPI